MFCSRKLNSLSLNVSIYLVILFRIQCYHHRVLVDFFVILYSIIIDLITWTNQEKLIYNSSSKLDQTIECRSSQCRYLIAIKSMVIFGIILNTISGWTIRCVDVWLCLWSVQHLIWSCYDGVGSLCTNIVHCFNPSDSK